MSSVARKIEFEPEVSELAPSRALACKVLYAAMLALKENGGSLDIDRVFEEVEKRVELDNWAKEKYVKTGYVRWHSILLFFTIDTVKAGWLVKKKGVWYITPEGEKALSKGQMEFFMAATKAYKEWRAKNPKVVSVADPENIEEEEIVENVSQDSVDRVKKQAADGIIRHIYSKGPYDFQDICAALLRAMGHHVRWVAPPGKDGGIDIIAYQDPLGTQPPRLKVQIKHRKDTTTGVQEIRQLLGLLKDGDVGIFISTGGFSSDARAAALNGNSHMELIDRERFIELWTEFYPKLSDEEQSMLPLLPVYFLSVA